MTGLRKRTTDRRRGAITACAAATALLLAACDTGDGTTLRAPTAPTTLPPVESAPLPSEVIESEPTATLPSDNGSVEDASAAVDGFEVFTPWAEGGTIDLRYTCDGANAAPAVSWSDVPAGTAEIAISMVNESDVSSGRPFIHWVMSGIDPATGRLGEDEVPLGTVQGINFFGDVGYTGPCPDPGTSGSYVITVFALGQQLEIADETPAAEFLDVIGTVAIGTADATGVVSR